MHADARVEMRILACERVHAGPRGQVDTDAERVRDGVLPHRVEHARQVVTQFGEVEVAVGVDEHREWG
jgi:hypothetical protein